MAAPYTRVASIAARATPARSHGGGSSLQSCIPRCLHVAGHARPGRGAARLAGEPHGLLVFVAVFLGGGWLIGWADAAPR
jgi:hypothetical protein